MDTTQPPREIAGPEDLAAVPPRWNVRGVAMTLRVLGGIDALALAAVVMPKAWIAAVHAEIGLGDFPAAPIAGYLARSASALYALHGLLVLYLSTDVVRYWPLIRFMAAAAMVHGVVMFGIDLAEGMPAWWLLGEGPLFAATGVLVLALQAPGGEVPRIQCSRQSD